MSASIGIIGLGIMGQSMAGQWLAAGYQVHGYDILPQACAQLSDQGGIAETDLQALAQQVDVIVMSLPSAQACQDVAKRIAPPCASSPQRKLVIETSTLSWTDKLAVGKCFDAARVDVLDCPILGTANQQGERQWTIYLSGPPKACESARELLGVLSQDMPYAGPFGAASQFKLLANHLVAIYNVAYAEVLNMARCWDLNPQRITELLMRSPLLATGVMHNRMPMMARRVYEPATMKIEIWQKDMQILQNLAKQIGAATPLLQACAAIYTQGQASGLGLQDTAAVAEVLSSASR
jgi:putative dehydrogenase